MGKHTPGPWSWFGNEYGFYLATVHSGRRFVMDFVRMGMKGAQPRFQIANRMINGKDLVRFEVDPTVMGIAAGKEAPSVYRYDIIGIDHPDAHLIAAAPQMREALGEALQSLEEIGGFLENEYGPAPLLTKIRAALNAADGKGE